MNKSKTLATRRNSLAGVVGQMSPKARQILFDDLLPLASSKTYPTVVKEIYRIDYHRRPVNVRTFLLDPEYLGMDVGTGIYPRIIDDLEELFDGKYTEVLLTGGIGWGKSRMAELGICYELYRLSCLRNVAQSYGLIPGSTLAFLVVSVTQSQAQNVLFRGLSDLICRSPYFQRKFPSQAHTRSEIRFPDNVLARAVATTENALLGEGVFSTAFDEMNFMQIVDRSKKQPDGREFDQAHVLYNRLSRRIRSRMNQRGQLPGHLWLISSSRYPNDFTERKEQEARDNPQIFLRRYAPWQTRPRSTFLPQNFKVEIGDTTRRTRVLDETESDVNVERVIEVPLDYLDEFKKDPDGCARDYAGTAILSVHPYVTRREFVARMFQAGEDTGLKHPFSKLDVTLQCESDYLIPENLHWIMKSRKGTTIRMLHSGPYFMHVDLARVRDAAGLAIGHVIGTVSVERGVGPQRQTEDRPLIRTDLILRIIAPPQGEILAANIRNLIYALSKLGCHFGKITYDSFGSMESIQILQSQGYKAEEFSVDKNLEGYESCKAAIYDGRVLCYEVPKLQSELVNLTLDERRGRVDHPPNGSKDLADAFAAMIHHCDEHYSSVTQSKAMAPQLISYPRNNREALMERLERGEMLTEEEFDAL